MRLEDAKMFQAADFFICKYNYIFVKTEQANNELWLVNFEHQTYPVIRLTTNSIDQVMFEEERLRKTFNAIISAAKQNGKMLDVHISNDVVSDKESFDTICLNTNYYSGISLDDLFIGIRNVINDVKNPDMEIHQITKHINDTQINKIKNERKLKAKQSDKPKITYTISIICMVVFGLIHLFHLINPDYSNIGIAIAFGGYYKAFVVGAMEYFKLLTTGFVHIDLIHLLMNLMALLSIGKFFEKVYGPKKYLSILLLSIIGGSLFVHIVSENTVVVGLSGGLYGLLGAMGVYAFSSGLIKNPFIRSQFISIILVNLMISLMPGVSLYGHFGGLVTGILLGIIFDENIKEKLLKKNALVALCCAFVVFGVLAIRENEIQPRYYATDAEVMDIYDSIGLDFYSSYLENQMLNYYMGD